MFAALAVASALSAAPATPFATALVMDGAWAVVNASVEGRPVKLIVDSAAGASVLDAAVAARLGLTPGVLGPVQGASGSAKSAASALVHRFAVAGLERRDMTVVLTDMSRFGVKEGRRYDGILGQDVLTRYSAVYSVPTGRLELFEADRAPGFSDRECQPNVADKGPPGFAMAEASLGAGAQARVIFDTGAAKSSFNLAAAGVLNLTPEHGLLPMEAGHGFDPAAVNQRYSTTLTTLKVMGRELGPIDVTVSDLDVYRAFGLESRPAGLLGANALARIRFSIGRGAHEVCFAAG